MVTGVLPILIGEGTKFGSISLDKNKTYNAEILLGISTETGDREGSVVKKNVECGKLEILEVLAKLGKKFTDGATILGG